MRKVGILLCILGSFLILVTFFGTGYMNFQRGQIIQDYKNRLPKYEILPGGDIGESEDSLEIEELTLEKSSIKNVSLGKMMAMLKIPSIDVELPLVEGDRKEDLKLAAGHIPGTALPGEEGNCAIAGHRSYTFGKYFNRLNEVQLGDEIIIENDDLKLIYKVDDIFIVEPEEVWVLDEELGQKIVTLITCEPVVKATHRWIVRGSLVEE